MTYPLKIDTGKPTVICEYCQKEFEQTTHHKRRFCCVQHQRAAHKARQEPETRNKPGYQRHYNRQYRENLMAQAFSILGNQCQHCGEKDPTVLCVDHIEPVGKARRMTQSIYWEIIQNPRSAHETYQLLCRNCNWKKMIENNERQPKERMYALKWETDELRERVHLLEHKFPRLRQRYLGQKIVLKKTIDNLRRETRKETFVVTGSDEEQEIEKKLMPELTQLMSEKSGKLDVNKMRVFLREKGIKISSWKAYLIKGNIEASNPQLFE